MTIKKAVDIGNEILALPGQQLAENSAKTLIMLLLLDQRKHNPEVAAEIERLNSPNDFLLQVLQKRLESVNVPVHLLAQCYLAFQCDRPGTVVLYAAALKAIYEKIKREVTLNDVIDAFPEGFPSEEQIHAIWNAQKCHEEKGSDNSLDHAESWT